MEKDIKTGKTNVKTVDLDELLEIGLIKEIIYDE
jgi:hypothetical protein